MQLNYKSFGQGDPVIILHGLFGTLDNWQTIAKKLADQYTVFIVDQRNHGKSPHTDTMNYALMAEDLKEFMETNWIYEASIIGHSMGGKTAMQMTLEYPEMINKLVVVDIGPQAYEGGHGAIFEALLSLDPGEIQGRKEAEAFLEAKIADFGVRQFLLKNLTRKKEGGYRWKMNLDTIHKAYSEILMSINGTEAFTGETLFIKGETSDYLSESDMVDIHKYFPQAKMKNIKKAGHWVHADAPDELLALLFQFLE